ncbi:MAG: class I SAM-dependent methyltransferase [Anaerolineae bacterium]
MMRWWRSRLRILSSQQAYAQWAQSYPAEAHNRLMQLEQEAMQALMPPLRGSTVLDLACGTGRYGQLALQAGAQQVIGCDNSLPMLQHGVLTSSACATTEAIPLRRASVDVVLCGLALGHVPQLVPSLREISRVLKPSGVALISDFHPYQALKGSQRTFRVGDTTYAVEHYVHHLSDYVTGGQAHHLQLIALREPMYQEQPVVLVLAYRKVSA